MSEFNNKDVLNLIDERDELSWFSRGKVKKDEQLMMLYPFLSEESYIITEMDRELLRKYNIFVPEKTKFKSNSGSFERNSFVAISDFHGYDYPIEKIVEHYLDEYEYIYILGDVTDRGPDNNGSGSLDLLLIIKRLTEQYPSRVVYIPGNHDSLIVGHDKGDSYCTLTMEYNNGVGTVSELKELKKKKPRVYKELIEWLSSLPIQRMHEYKGQIYAFAHAFFDQNLYEIMPTYNLEDYFDDHDLRNYGYNVMWFRKSDVFDRGETIADEKARIPQRKYIRSACPDSSVTVVIGHSKTRAGSREHDLVNKYGDKVTVHCVDGGIAYNGQMLKYDGGSKTYTTVRREHNDTSGSVSDISKAEAALKNYVVTSVYMDKLHAFDREKYLMPASISNEEFAEVIDSYDGRFGFSYTSGDYQDRFWMYRMIVMFDIILQNLLDKYGNKESVYYLLNGYFFGDEKGEFKGDDTWFTRERDTRFLADALGLENMIEVLAAYNCDSVEQYLERKTELTEKGKIKIRR